MPRSCSEADIKYALNHLSILPIPKNQSIISDNTDKLVCEVTCRPTDFQPDLLFWLVTVILGVTVAVCVFATIADFYQEDADNYSNPKKSMNSNGFLKYFLAFSLLANGRSLMRISKNPNNLKGVECIRWVVD